MATKAGRQFRTLARAVVSEVDERLPQPEGVAAEGQLEERRIRVDDEDHALGGGLGAGDVHLWAWHG